MTLLIEAEALALKLYSLLEGYPESVALAALFRIAAAIMESNTAQPPPEVLVFLAAMAMVRDGLADAHYGRQSFRES